MQPPTRREPWTLILGSTFEEEKEATEEEAKPLAVAS